MAIGHRSSRETPPRLQTAFQAAPIRVSALRLAQELSPCDVWRGDGKCLEKMSGPGKPLQSEDSGDLALVQEYCVTRCKASSASFPSGFKSVPCRRSDELPLLAQEMHVAGFLLRQITF